SAPDVPSRTLRAAENEAVRIFAAARVRLVWTAGAGDFRLQITADSPRGLAPDAVGFAVLTPRESGYAAVSWRAVECCAAQLDASPEIALGAALAHEIGHLMLGPAHSRSGVMSAHLGTRELDLASRGELRFDRAQGKELLRAIAAQPSQLQSPTRKSTPSV